MMKRIFSGLLATALAASHLPLTALADDSAEATAFPDAQGNLSVVVALDYAEVHEKFQDRDFAIQLVDKNTQQSFTIPMTALEDGGFSGELDGKTFTARMTLLNEEDVPISGSERVGFYQIDMEGLPNNHTYTVQLSAKGYRPMSSEEISIGNSSRKLFVSGYNGGFSLGDVNGDSRIDKEDLKAVSDALPTGSARTGGPADLNQDGVIDITDIALVNHNQREASSSILYDTHYIDSLLPTMVDGASQEKEIADKGITVSGGTLSDLFVSNGTAVTLTPSESISEETPLIVPIPFSEPVDMSEVTLITPPMGTNGSVETGVGEVLYVDENGKEQTMEIPFDSTAPEGVLPISRTAQGNTIVISLGRRVAVKKITIRVTKVAGSGDFAVVEEVAFLKDIVPANVDLEASVPKNVKAVAGSKQVTLSWDPVKNVSGYRIRYGEKSGAYTKVAETDTTSIVIGGLDNLKTYYFTVSSTAPNNWVSKPSQEVSAIPMPSAAPLPPDGITLTPQDQSLSITWKKTEDAETYQVYYKESSQPDSAYKMAGDKIQETTFPLGGLTNGTEYSVYVVACNQIGNSGRSRVYSAVPEKVLVEGPVLPTMNRIPNEQITAIRRLAPGNVDNSFYPNGYDDRFVIDGDYSTHWTAANWGKNSAFEFTFQEPQDMNYLIYAPRQDAPYPTVLQRYSVTAWDEEGNQYFLTADENTLSNAVDNGKAPVVQKYSGGPGTAYVLPFQRCKQIKKIQVKVRQRDGTPAPVSLSEIAFYTYGDLDQRIGQLFSDSSYTSLSEGVTLEQINLLRTEAENAEGYYVEQSIMLDELDLAQALLEGDTSAIGTFQDGIQSWDGSGLKTVSTLQPLGVVAESETASTVGKKSFVIYATIPQGETVTVVPTQYFGEASAWKGKSITLQNGRNVISIPQITSKSGEKGGALYLRYTGSRGDEIKLHIRGESVQKIPVLELADFHQLSSSEVSSRISRYAQELEDYVNSLPSGNRQQMIRNSTEISLPHVLLSLPAEQVWKGISSDPETVLFNNVLTWEEVLETVYTTHGVDDLEGENSRHNIRYMEMFGSAFMYASGDHIGIGYGSAPGVVAGRPTSVTGTGHSNSLFGWGIGHEIGHVMDSFGKAEITNNIYAIMLQTRDGGDNALTSRIEASGKYAKIFDKTSSGVLGLPNDVFVQLGMYWQLHLAYDGADDNIYNEINKLYRAGDVSGFSGDDKFAVAASMASGYDLTEFFTSWGMELSSSAKSAMAGYPAEDRKIQFLSDESRRARMRGEAPASGSVQVEASQNQNEITLSLNSSFGSEIQGYQIIRNGRSIAFLPAGETSYVDRIGSANNISLQYEVRVIDILGNVAAEGKAAPLEMHHDNLISPDKWSAEKKEDGSWLVTFADPTDVAGIQLKNLSPSAKQAVETEESTETKETLETGESLPQNSETGESSDTESPETEESSPETEETTEETETTGETETTEEETTEETQETEGIVNQLLSLASARALSSTGISARPLSLRTGETEETLETSEDYVESSETSEQTEQTDPETEETEETSETTETEESVETEESTETADPVESTDPSDSSDSSEEGTRPPEDTSNKPNETGDAVPPADSSTPASSATGEGQPPAETSGTASSSVEKAEAEKPDPTENLIVEVSQDGETFTTVLTLPLSGDNIYEQTIVHLFTNPDQEGSILIQKSKYIRIQGLPAGDNLKEMINFTAYPGDSISFLEDLLPGAQQNIPAIGRLEHDYDCGDQVLKEGTLVIVGNYRGDPAFNSLRINGRFTKVDQEDGTSSVQERPINGQAILFAVADDSNPTGEISNGLWIFVPNVQQEEELNKEDGVCHDSVLPSEIQAELWHSDDPNDPSAGFKVSDTNWISSPADNSMPSIRLE